MSHRHIVDIANLHAREHQDAGAGVLRCQGAIWYNLRASCAVTNHTIRIGATPWTRIHRLSIDRKWNACGAFNDGLYAVSFGRDVYRLDSMAEECGGLKVNKKNVRWSRQRIGSSFEVRDDRAYVVDGVLLVRRSDVKRCERVPLRCQGK